MNTPAQDGENGSALIGGTELSRLKWRCRRGLLENDLFIERFFQRHEATLTVRHADGLQALTELADNDLLDLLLARREPEGELARPEVSEVLGMLRATPVPTV
ncbi:FAD assembly factor SdhE [Aquabacterium sp. OR-4]|uniref:FAD assembly factor SdhE n=1 Tax=Aquabacterium sp. OR-4 TaxID=2978127 RepID=UPI0021B1B3C5|nr:succinate dehydrogenase assembly factor 2 [Aquabacterium sp. OR-4]MDT7835624.1 succinate dehydrogenase assembly factor 2 [Aquabacterium sp. OR-4]